MYYVARENDSAEAKVVTDQDLSKYSQIYISSEKQPYQFDSKASAQMVALNINVTGDMGIGEWKRL